MEWLFAYRLAGSEKCNEPSGVRRRGGGRPWILYIRSKDMPGTGGAVRGLRLAFLCVPLPEALKALEMGWDRTRGTTRCVSSQVSSGIEVQSKENSLDREGPAPQLASRRVRRSQTVWDTRRRFPLIFWIWYPIGRWRPLSISDNDLFHSPHILTRCPLEM